jgi:exopolyphosphatase/guanosine-5'-triphosphate,3'-diphosphate pyrophosphatase
MYKGESMNRWIFIWTLIFISTFSSADVVRRACFDIGSGSTKLVVADVDTETKTVNVIFEEDAKVDYKEDLLLSADNTLSDSILRKGLGTLASLAIKAHKKGAVQFAGVGTDVFRTAKNGEEYLEEVYDKLGIMVKLITQEEEALLGYLAATQGESGKNFIVWDIGGSSMQISYQSDKFYIYSGNFASVTMARYIIEKIQGHGPEVRTPNPVQVKEAEQACEYVASLAKEVEPEIKEAIKEATVIGIGGVHYYSVRNQVKKGKNYDIDSLFATLKAQCNKTDQQIGGEYANTEVGNLILVYGYMKELGIKTVKVKKINMAHALLMFPPLW